MKPWSRSHHAPPSAWILPWLVILLAQPLSSAPVVLVGPGSPVRFQVPATALPANWKDPGFDDASWTAGSAALGYDLDTRNSGAEGMTGLWAFDNATLLGLDSGPLQNHLVPRGSPGHSASGRRGGALTLNGEGSFLAAPAVPVGLPFLNGPYTISVWFKPLGQGARGLVGWGAYGDGVGLFRGMMVALRQHGANGFRHYWWAIDLDAEAGTLGVNIHDGEWHHLVAWYDGNRRALFLDGRELASDLPSRSGLFDIVPTPQDFTVGTTGPEYFHGSLDDVAVWNIALPLNQVRALYEEGNPLALPEPHQVSFKPRILTDLQSAMAGQNASVVVRVPFVHNPASISGPHRVVLRMAYDSGFVAYLNGVEVARRNAPATPAWNSAATADRPDAAALQVERLDIAHLAQLNAGANVLALHGLNDAPGSSDFLLVPELLLEPEPPDLQRLPTDLEQAPVRVWVPAGSLPAQWADPGFDDSRWREGGNGVGYDVEARNAGAAGLGAWWAFDLPQGLGVDSGPNANLLVPVGQASSDPNGRHGAALKLDGFSFLASPAFPVGVPTGNSPYTIAAWIKPAQGGACGIVGWGFYAALTDVVLGTAGLPPGTLYGKVTALRLNGNNAFSHYWWANDLGGDAGALGYTLRDGRWHHITARFTGSERTLWLNGQLLARDTAAGVAHDALPMQFTVGKTFLRELWAGSIDDLAIWSVALDDQQVIALARGASPLTLPNPGDLDFYRVIQTDVRAAMHNQNASVLIRIPFNADGLHPLQSIRLKVRYDAGFAAYLNGQEVARRNAPAALQWNSSATGSRAAGQALTAEIIDITPHSPLVRPGLNVLAFHGLNESAAHADFVLHAALEQESADQDFDGIPDRWEFDHQLDPFNAADAWEDTDGDGYSNRAEFDAGTDPRNPSSHLRVERILVERGVARIRFRAAAYRAYDVEVADSLDGGWNILQPVTPSPVDRMEEVAELDEQAAIRFYRVVARGVSAPPAGKP